MKKTLVLTAICVITFCIGCTNNANKSASPTDDSTTVESLDTVTTLDVRESTIPKRSVAEEKVSKPKANTFAGTYVCDRFRDIIKINEDGTGTITYNSAGGAIWDFTWKRFGKKIIADFKDWGKQTLIYNSKDKSLTENSKDFGKLVYYKDEYQ